MKIEELLYEIATLKNENKNLKRELECARIVNKQHRKLNGLLRKEYNKILEQLEKSNEFLEDKYIVDENDEVYLYLNDIELNQLDSLMAVDNQTTIFDFIKEDK